MNRKQLEDAKTCPQHGCDNCQMYQIELDFCQPRLADTALELLDKTEAQEKEIQRINCLKEEALKSLKTANRLFDEQQKEIEQLTEEIRVLREQLPEKDSMMIKLPCKVGDIVYVDKNTLYLGNLNWKRCLYPKYIRCEVINIRFTKKQKLIKVNPLIEENCCSRHYRLYPFSAIGITVFLTQEEAGKVIGGGQ